MNRAAAVARVAGALDAPMPDDKLRLVSEPLARLTHEERVIETAKGIVRLLPVGERAKQLFGEEGASAVIRKFDAERKPNPQLVLDFMAEQRAAVPEVKSRGRRKKAGDAAAGLRTRKEARCKENSRLRIVPR